MKYSSMCDKFYLYFTLISRFYNIYFISHSMHKQSSFNSLVSFVSALVGEDDLILSHMKYIIVPPSFTPLYIHP